MKIINVLCVHYIFSSKIVFWCCLATAQSQSKWPGPLYGSKLKVSQSTSCGYSKLVSQDAWKDVWWWWWWIMTPPPSTVHFTGIASWYSELIICEYNSHSIHAIYRVLGCWFGMPFIKNITAPLKYTDFSEMFYCSSQLGANHGCVILSRRRDTFTFAW